MDTAKEAMEYRDMAHGQVNQLFVDDLIAGGAIGPRTLDLGTGPAAIPILICERLDDVEIMAVDSAVEMLEVAKIEIELAGMVGRISLQHADAKSLEGFEADSIDTVISNSLIHHLADPSLALAAAIQMVRPGGRLFFRDLARPDNDAKVESLVKEYTGDESEYAQQLFRQSLHAALTENEIQHLAGGFGIETENVQMTSDRHWTIDWLKPQ